MGKTTFYLPDDLQRALHRKASATGRSKADLILEGIALVTGAHRSAVARLPLFESGAPDLADQLDNALHGFGER